MNFIKIKKNHFLHILSFLIGAMILTTSLIFFYNYKINIFLFISFAFIFTFAFGHIIEKIRVPWIFAALLFGLFLAVYNPFSSITESGTFSFLAQLGMYFLLFVIGFEINIKDFKKQSKFILKSTFFIIFLEAFVGSFIVHFIFGYDWIISIIVSLSFATVGEAILIPILDEFKITNTRLGQLIIGIGTLDDIIEIAVLIVVIFLIGSDTQNSLNVGLIISSLIVLFIFTIGFSKLKKEGKKFSFSNIETVFLFTIFILFLFIGIGSYAESAPLAAFLAGISLKTFMPEKRRKLIESEVKTISYGFFAPIFFLWVGSSMNIGYLVSYPLLIILVVAASNGTKILSSYIMGRKKLGTKKSILLGLGLSVRFSTSIVIIKILFDNGLIGSDIFSIIIASSIVFTFIIPILFSNFIIKWKITKKNKM